MIGQTISHYHPPADLSSELMSFWFKYLADKIVENSAKGEWASSIRPTIPNSAAPLRWSTWNRIGTYPHCSRDG